MVDIKAWAHDPSAESVRAIFKLLEGKLKHYHGMVTIHRSFQPYRIISIL